MRTEGFRGELSAAIRLKRRKAGFTLIELLVVVAIIVTLIALLVPSLSGAKERARAAACGSNMRGLFQGVTMYANDNDGWMDFVSPAVTMGNYDKVNYPYVVRFMNYSRTQNTAPKTTFIANWQNATSYTFNPTDGFMENYFHMKALNCPSTSYVLDYANPNNKPLRYYAFNIATDGQYVENIKRYTAPLDTVFAGDAAFVNPNAATALYGTGDAANTPIPDANSWLKPSTRANPVFHGRHTGQGTVGWFDGHVTLETPTYGSTKTLPTTGYFAGSPLAGKLYSTLKLGDLASPGSTNSPYNAPDDDYYFLYDKSAKSAGYPSTLIGNPIF